MALVVKQIGKRFYQYRVTWDPKRKRQVWEYVGPVSPEGKPVVVSISLDEGDVAEIDAAWEWARGRMRNAKHHQSGAKAYYALDAIRKKIAKARAQK